MINIILRLLCVWVASMGIWLGTVPWAMAQAQPRAISQEQISQAEALFNKAFEAIDAGDLTTAESYLSQILEQFPENPAIWSNRGNVRTSQNKLEEALEDYERAISLAPEVPDVYINRGVALEGLGRWEEAIADYNRALSLDEKDPLAYNNRGNAEAGSGQWQAAIADYKKASELAPNYAFARGNYALALYQVGDIDLAIATMKNLTRKYPQFADMRAALTAALWAQGQLGEAESNWVAAYGLDPRYKSTDWVASVRRWPPKMVIALESFLKLSR